MQPATANYKVIRKAKDDRFDEEFLHLYELNILTGPKDFQIAVIDSEEKRLLLLEDYAMGHVQSHSDLMAALKELFDEHALLKAGFWKLVKIGIKNSKFCQVPAGLFDPAKAIDYLKLNAPVDAEKEKVFFNQNEKSESINVFAVPIDLYEYLTGIYQNTQHLFFHQSSALTEGVLECSDGNANPLYVYIDRFKMHLISSAGGKLIYYNQFPIKQFSDYVKYIMLVLKTLHMDQLTSEIVLWGYIGRNSPHYQEFVKYVRNVTFGGRPKYLKFGYFFDEIQEHHFFDLYSLNLLQGE